MKGRNLHRLKDNPCEKAFAEAWSKRPYYGPNGYADSIDHICGCGGEMIDKVRQTDCASVIQWLGSPVGQKFVIDVLESQGLVKRVPPVGG